MATTDPEISRNLMPGERVQWSGRPGQGILFTPRDTFMIPFSLLWCGFALFWEFSVSRTGAPSFFMLWGAMFVCVGLYFVFGRFLFDAWIRSRMSYAVTDQRILITRPPPFGTFTAVSLQRVPDMRFNDLGGGRGTIRFGEAPSMFAGRGFSSWSPALDPTPQLLAVDNAKSVFDLLQRSSHGKS